MPTPARSPHVRALLAALCLLAAAPLFAQAAPAYSAPPQAQRPPLEQSAQASATPVPAETPAYDKAIFQRPIPPAQLAFLKQFDRAPANDLIRDKQFRSLKKQFIPDCMFHYGSDKPLDTSLDEVLDGSRQPVQLRDGRYLLVSGAQGPYLAGRGFLWIDLQDGVALGGFFFHPTNGEPTPTVTIFSRQIKERGLSMNELPPAFAEDLAEWDRQSHISPVTTRYFISGLNKRILLEHSEEYCSPSDGTVAPPDTVCEQMDADAADIDLNTANYLEQIHYATNGTAWMINGPEQIAWIGVRDRTCGVGPDPLGCRIRMTRERTHVIIRRRG
jgi:uncharacterized protein YecT (DUF1311 family)